MSVWSCAAPPDTERYHSDELVDTVPLLAGLLASVAEPPPCPLHHPHLLIGRYCEYKTRTFVLNKTSETSPRVKHTVIRVLM